LFKIPFSHHSTQNNSRSKSNVNKLHAAKPFWESASFSSVLEILSLFLFFLFEPKNSSPSLHYPENGPYPETHEYNPKSSHMIYLRSISVLTPIYAKFTQSGLFPSGVQTKLLYALIISPLSRCRPLHYNLFVLISLIIFGEDYKV
jgi:hypothetical protein